MSDVTIQPGTTILVTGVNGLIGSYIVGSLLKKGYHVRGAVRDVEKSSWLLDHFNGTQDAKLDLVSVPDMTIEGCYDDVVKGTSGIIHVASPLSGADPESTIPIGISAALNALSAAAKTPSITRVVYTSSSIAATFPTYSAPKPLDQSSWNEEGIAKGWQHPADEPASRKGLYIYAALKASSEKTCWKFMHEEKPGFVLNTVLPNCNFGRVLVPQKQGAPSTIEWAKYAWEGANLEAVTKIITPQFYISTQDSALLHVAALLNPAIASERIFGFAERWDFNKLLAVYRARYPERQFPADIEGLVDDKCVPPSERAEEILKWIKDDGKGWDTLEDMAGEMAEQFASGEL
ncbi:aldehyde reductase [Karstenula rhodostoma CBS 690.94]|uniref:Aldehyde reductase n=1 Tax=Karstenula rhodostoma CBS 690.94 TaxID=1392251 RepID=A0A9P4PJ75_9PLEO|nr:aldehyde reductase [Karstenula rhodostoma CBS 690.94]